jgi:hypothetical protein
MVLLWNFFTSCSFLSSFSVSSTFSLFIFNFGGVNLSRQAAWNSCYRYFLFLENFVWSRGISRQYRDILNSLELTYIPVSGEKFLMEVRLEFLVYGRKSWNIRTPLLSLRSRAQNHVISHYLLPYGCRGALLPRNFQTAFLPTSPELRILCACGSVSGMRRVWSYIFGLRGFVGVSHSLHSVYPADRERERRVWGTLH